MPQALRCVRDLRWAGRPAAELLAALADSHPIEPVPVPEGAGFVEALGRPPTVRPA
jgi:hypothetical protein